MSRKREKRKRFRYGGKESPAQYMIDEATSTTTVFGPSSWITVLGPRSFSATATSLAGESTSTATDWDSFDWDYTWG